MQSARKLLADTCVLLELQIEKLTDAKTDVDDRVQAQSLEDLITKFRKSLTLALDIRGKALAAGFSDKPELNLEAARAEIESRLARLAS